MENEAAVRMVGARKVYGSGETEVKALDGVDLSIGRGRFTAVMGPSGAGKSTLMHCAAGLDPLSGGQVFVGKVELGELTERQLTVLRRERLGFVFQAFNLLPTLPAIDNIVLPLTLGGRRPDPGWLTAVVDAVGLGDRLRHRPSELSGGQQQRVAIARALVTRPEVVFADEPTGALDSRTGEEILAFLREAVTELGRTVVMVTHEPTAAAYADEAVFLVDGRVDDVMAGPAADKVLDRMKALGER
ncbi:ABC transporter ATP-binding protein [Actinocorallia longicatena]|uniref:ABC transporter ATP-binding protein n=1 Tax=Actinocorallia longicatena TaxID=111803 RepID=A0ABP6QBN2_9ACTN